jgi:hypothetical protein
MDGLSGTPGWVTALTVLIALITVVALCSLAINMARIRREVEQMGDVLDVALEERARAREALGLPSPLPAPEATSHRVDA